MTARLIRPEDRCRSFGGNGAETGNDNGNGNGVDWADTVPAWFRSEAFAEDLAPGDADAAPARRARQAAAPRPLRRGRPWMPLFGLSLAAVFGLRGTARDRA